MKPDIRTYAVDLPFGFHLRRGTEDGLALFLHGYTDSGAAFLRRALSSMEPDWQPPFSLLAPNGPFPVPVRRGDSYRAAYAWYFWDYATDAIIMPPAIATGLVAALIDDLGYRDTPKVLIGFSQGGFLMPHLLPRLHNVTGLIAVGSSFRPDDYPADLHIPVHAVHGDADTVIDAAGARRQFNLLKRAHPHDGVFHVVPGLGHTVSEQASALLLDIIHSCFQKTCE